MVKPNPANPALPISDTDLTSALKQIGAEIDHQPLRSSALARIMRMAFGGSDASGAWNWRMAYDLMQAAAVQILLRDGSEGDIAAAKLAVKVVVSLSFCRDFHPVALRQLAWRTSR